ncbi:MAG: phosphomannomutase/phosphoglucomutase [Campylobacterales bacterium]
MVDLKIFREYDIRGIFPTQLSEQVVKNIGYQLGKRAPGPLFISYDPRLSSKTLFNWLVSGIISGGGKVVGGEMLPTGANYFANYTPVPTGTQQVKVAGSIQITGSHNPPEYNGFKITLNRCPFFGEELKKLGKLVKQEFREIPDNPTFIPSQLKEAYISYLVEEFAHLKGFQLGGILDPGNGAVGPVLKEILERLQFKGYRLLNWEPDGHFPNHHPDPTEEENLGDLKKGLQEGYRFGFGFDGDGDRIVILDPSHTYSGDQLLYFLARGIQEEERRRPVVITEVKVSEGVIKGLERIGSLILWKTGHSNLKEKVAETSADLAGEVSGHLFFNDRYFGYDDGIYGFLRLVELLQRGFQFPQLLRELGEWVTTPEIKIPVPEERKFQIVAQLRELVEQKRRYLPIVKVIDIDGVRLQLPEGWGLVRASNTTPVLTTRFEAQTRKGLRGVIGLFQQLLGEVGVPTDRLEGVVAQWK